MGSAKCKWEWSSKPLGEINFKHVEQNTVLDMHRLEMQPSDDIFKTILHDSCMPRLMVIETAASIQVFLLIQTLFATKTFNKIQILKCISGKPTSSHTSNAAGAKINMLGALNFEPQFYKSLRICGTPNFCIVLKAHTPHLLVLTRSRSRTYMLWWRRLTSIHLSVRLIRTNWAFQLLKLMQLGLFCLDANLIQTSPLEFNKFVSIS